MKISVCAPLLLCCALPLNHAHAGPRLDADDLRVIKKLESVLTSRVTTTSGGRVPFKIVPTERASEGFFAEISGHAQNAVLRRLFVSSVGLTARNVQIDVPALMELGKIRTRQSNTQMRAVVSEADLTKMLAQGRHTKSMNLQVRYLADRLFVTGNLNYTLINGPVQGTARLRRGDDDKVYLDILSLKLRGAEIPAFVKNRFSAQINPVIDIEDLPFNPRFKSVKIVGNKAILST